MQDAAHFAGQWNAGALAEPKVPRIIIQVVFAEPDANFGRADV